MSALRRHWSALEDASLASALALVALIPLVESALRAVLHVGIPGAASLAQHCALLAGMLGAVVAAREQRLLALSTLSAALGGWRAQAMRSAAGVIATVVCGLLALGSAQFLLTERDAGNPIIAGLPVWLGQIALPLGFGVMALRFAFQPGGSWQARVAAVAAAALAMAAAASGWALGSAALGCALAIVLAGAVLGTPVFITLGGAALFLFWADGLPIAALALDHYRMVVNPSLPMIPLFTLTGYLLAEGGGPRRLIRVCRAFFGGFRGGAAMVTVVACVFFAAFSGASGVTIIALGGMLMPLLLGAGYSQKNALGLLAASGSLGGLLPPGLPLVLYALVAKVSIEDMFLAGLLPGLLMAALVAAWGVACAPRTADTERSSFDWREARSALAGAKWELALAPVAFVALFGGFATPVEAAALTVLYAFVVEVFVYRDLDLRRDVPRVLVECGLVIGGVLLILGVALGLTNYLVDARVPERMLDWARLAISSSWEFLLALNLLLLAAGCVLDIFSATVVLVPLLLPLAAAFGIDPIHLGIVFLVNLELGYLTPPVGMNLFFTAYRFGRPLPEVIRAALPALAVLGIAVVLVTLVPSLATFLPRLFR